MSNTLPIKKIFVDSRYSTNDSTSDSDFKIQLGRNIFLPDDCIMHIEHVVIPMHGIPLKKESINVCIFKLFKVLQHHLI